VQEFGNAAATVAPGQISLRLWRAAIAFSMPTGAIRPASAAGKFRDSYGTREVSYLQISETAYTFSTTTETRNNCQGHPRATVNILGKGSLNRITGEISVQATFKSSDDNQSDTTVWKGTCVPAQRKF
jgi:hypothetical protein